MVRAPFYDKNGIKRGAWSSEEDDKLRAYVERYGYWNWRQIPKYAGLSRCGKSCRLRWMNYLRPDVKRGNYTAEEVSLIIKLHEEHGNKWSLIAANLPGRTDNEIKNYWHTHLKKGTTYKTPTTTSQSPREDRSCDDSSHQCEQTCHITNGEAETESSNNHDAEEIYLPPILESSQSPADTISTNISPGSPSVLTSHTSSISDSDYFSHENNNYLSSPFEVLYEEYYSTGSDFWTEPFLEDNMSSLNDGSYLTCYGDGASSHGLSYYDDGTEMEYFFYQ